MKKFNGVGVLNFQSALDLLGNSHRSPLILTRQWRFVHIDNTYKPYDINNIPCEVSGFE